MIQSCKLILQTTAHLSVSPSVCRNMFIDRSAVVSRCGRKEVGKCLRKGTEERALFTEAAAAYLSIRWDKQSPASKRREIVVADGGNHSVPWFQKLSAKMSFRKSPSQIYDFKPLFRVQTYALSVTPLGISQKSHCKQMAYTVSQWPTEFYYRIDQLGTQEGVIVTRWLSTVPL